MNEFILPNLGDGVAAGDVLRVMVKVGDVIAVDQPVLELETDKATLEVPSTVAGRVAEVKVKAGDKVKPGQAVLAVEDGGGKPAAAAEPAPDADTDDADAKAEAEAEGEGANAKAPAAAAAKAAAPAQDAKAGEGESARGRASAAADSEERRDKVLAFSAGKPAAPAAEPGPLAPAAPSVRRLARELGVDLHQVPGTGPGGRITQEDVKAFTKHVMASLGGGGQASVATRSGGSAAPLPDFSKWGSVERKPMSGIRRKTAEHLSNAWNTIPHVTQFDRADITQLEQVRKKYRAEVEKAGGNLTVTAIATKVVAAALKVFPQFNASVDAAGEAIVYKQYVHVGIAVDTENGLLVPVVRDADRKNLTEISVEIQQLAEKAKARKLTLDDMSGGSMSISNLGGIGGTFFTPIVNWPEVAILGISRGGFEPVWNGTSFEPRQMLPLSLSYDHRLIDGADAIRFLRWVVDALENPFTLTLRG
ncbi:MAG: 2-oxo acid dehydrogenase subunit E2 [Vicinamibacterales bacterium]